jgi:transcriptional regulator with XRE-family HTH domain
LWLTGGSHEVGRGSSGSGEWQRVNQLANKPTGRSGGGRSRALDVDHYVSLRIRQRRIMLGLTQQQMAELIGVTYQQAHKYETGINRISSGRLYQIAQALGVEVSYFFEDVEPERRNKTKASELMPQQRMLLELARNFAGIGSRKHQDALCNLARVLANGEASEA